jgi:hypothetical protein
VLLLPEITHLRLLIRKETISTERSSPVEELVPTFVDRGVSRGQRGGSPTAVNLSVF